MKVLVVGGGGREHALCRSLSRSANIDRIYAAPGNAGIAELATNAPLSSGDVSGLVEFAERESIDLVVVGPEAPLVAGLADELQAAGVPVFGPTRAAARIEASKAWARRLCEANAILGPASAEFDDLDSALAHLDRVGGPVVVKADGLAAGKGVVVAEDRDRAEAALVDALVRKRFGEAGERVVIEERLDGVEVTATALTDGRTVLPLAFAHDYKRALEGDRGPNTGGMGAYSPLPFVDAALEAEIVGGVLEKGVRALKGEGVRFRGLLYAGLMLTADGPRLLEFNCRFGDPEAQVVLPRLESNLGELLLACVEGNLADYRLRWTPEACVGVVLTAAGYPGDAPVGQTIDGLNEAAADGAMIFHAGTARRDGRVVTSGGRVLTVSALGADLDAARDRAYAACERISFQGMTLRPDIARDVPAAPPGG